MQVDVVVLALLTAMSWGASAPLSKLGMNEGGRPIQAALTVVAVSVVAYGTVILVRGETLLGYPLWVVGLFAATGLAATALARALAYNGVERLGASVNSAGINTRPVWASLLAVFLLGEALTAQMGLGILVVVAGLIALALSEGGDVTGWEYHQLAFPLAAAVTFAGGNVARRFALTTTDVTPLAGVAVNETAGLVGLLVYLLLRHRGDVGTALAAPRRAYAYFVGSGLLNALALFSLFAALDRGRVVVVDPLSSPTALFAILLTAVLLLDVERITPRLVAGGVLVVTGVVLITGPQLLVL